MKTLQAFLKVLMSKVQYTPPDTDVIVPFLLLLLTSSMDTRRSPCFAEKDPWSFAIRQKNKDAGLKYQAEALTKLNDFIAFAT